MNGSFAKKIFASFALLLVLSGVAFSSLGAIGSAFSPNVAHAQYDWNTGGGQFSAPEVENTTVDPNQSSGTLGTDPETGGGTQEIDLNGNTTTNDPDDEQGQDITSKEIECELADVLCGLVKFVGFLFTFTSNLVAAVAGIVVDFSLWYSIQSGSYGLINPFLESGWKMILGFTNLIFIFTLFVVAFSLIFGTDIMKIEPKRAFGYVVLMALLVNFSFFMTRTVIEFGNTVAVVLYEKIGESQEGLTYADSTGNSVQTSGAQSMGSPSTFFSDNQFFGLKSISLGILNKINPQQLILDSSTGVTSSGAGFYVTYLFLSIAVAVFNMVLIYIFVSMAILFFGRFVGLAFIIIFSPIAFASVAIPKLKEQSYVGFDDWIKELVGLTLVAPLYLIFIYLTILFLNTNLFPATQTGYLLMATVIFIKLLITALVLLRGKALAVSMSGHVGSMAGGLIGTAATLALGAATGGTAMLARQTIGRAGAAVATNGSLQRIATGGPSEKIQAVQNRLASGIRNFGVGKYRLGNTGVGRSVSGAVQNSGLSNIGASTAGGLQRFGKNLYTVNPLDRAIGGMSARKAAGMLGGVAGSPGLNTSLAKDYVADMQKKQVRDRAINIAAIANAKKTLTNVNANAMTAGLNSAGAAPTTGPNTGGSSGAITVTGPNTGAIPQATGWTGARGPVPGARVPNDFNGMKLAPPATVTLPKSAPTVTPETPEVAAKNDGAAARAEYDRTKQIENAQMASGMVPELAVENLTVKNLNVNTDSGKGLPSRPSGMGKGDAIGATSPVTRATNLLSGIQSAPSRPVGALQYNPQVFQPKSTTSSPAVVAPRTTQNTEALDPMVQQLVDSKKEEIKKIESDRSEFIKDMNSMGTLDNAGSNKAMGTINEYDAKRKSAYEELKEIKKTSVSGAADQSGLISDSLPGDFGGMGPRDQDE